MKIRFINYKDDIYVVIGISYDYSNSCPEFFLSVPINEYHPSITRSLLESSSIKIPFVEAIEITKKEQILALMVLYGG